MDRLDLGWLRILVEVVERGSLSAAAKALGMTQPAVSYQVRRLEEQLGTAVLARHARGVELTPVGRQMFDVAKRSVDEFDALARTIGKRQSGRTIRLRTDYAFAAFWLMPRMDTFRCQNPELDIQIVATQRFQPEQMEEGDVAVVFGEVAAHESATLLVPEEVTPVCNRQIADKLDLEGLASSRLIHLDADAGAPWFDWPSYFEAAGLAARAAPGVGDIRLNTYSLVLQAALENQGIALGWTGLVDTYLRMQFLVPAGPTLRAEGRGYLLLPPRRQDANSQALINWMIEQAVETVQAR